MPAYVIVDIEITDPEEYEEYKKHTPGSLVPFDGKFLTRGGVVENLEGDWKPSRLVILEFPSMEKAKAWWNSPGYASAKLIRQRASNTQMIVADGI